MKTLIIGLGNIGTIHGWALSEAGCDITHVVRPGSMVKYAGGIAMDVLDLREEREKHYTATYMPRIVEQVGPKDGFELVIVATNHYQAADVVSQYKSLVPDADVLLFTGNWEGTGQIDAILPRTRYLWGFSVSSGARDSDGVLYANLQKTFRVNELDGRRTERLDRIITMFQAAGISPDIKPDIIGWLWVHFAIDAGMIGAAIYSGGFPAANDNSNEAWETRIRTVRAVKDAFAVLKKRGFEVWSFEDAAPFRIADDRTAAQTLWQPIMNWPHYERSRKHSHIDTSPEEMKRFFLDVVATGEQLGVPMPCLSAMKDRISG